MNADGIKDQDMLVLNIKFTPDPIVGFVSEDRTLRVEFVHIEEREGSDLHDGEEWKFANQSVFTATGGASDEVDGLGFDNLGGANVPSA